MNIGATIEWAAARHKIDPVLVSAVILQESDGRVYCARQERGFARRYGLFTKRKEELGGFWPERTAETRWEYYERETRSISFGLMQVIGQLAREYGYTGEDLFELCQDYATNLDLGCKKLATCLRQAAARGSSTIIEDLLLCYNGGGDPEYPAKVLARRDNGTALKFLKEGHVRPW